MRLGTRHVLPLLLALAGCGSAGSSTNPTHPPSTALAPPAAAPAENVLPDLPADPREALLAQKVRELLSSQHLRGWQIDDAVSKQAFVAYLDRLDGGKVYLLKEHVAQLQPHADKMDDQLKRGDLELGRKGYALLGRRRVVVARMVAELLANPLDLNANEQLQTDPDKRAYASDEAELRARWRMILKLQVLERIEQLDEASQAQAEAKKAPAKDPKATVDEKLPTTLEGREKKARDELAQRYASRFTRLADTDPLEPATRFLNAIAAVFDPHTSYLPPAQRDNFDIAMSGSLEGIGAVLAEEDSYIAVREVVPGGAAWRQGQLEAGDLITAVAQKGAPSVDITDMPISKVVRMIRGKKGTTVKLAVKKPDGATKTISIKRDVVQIEAAFARGAVLKRDASPPMGYVKLPSFYGSFEARPGRKRGRNATDDVRKLLVEFQKRKLSGFIFDLRGNGGGLLGHAQDITGLLIETGPVVQTRYPNGKTDILSDRDPSISFDKEVVVLVDRASASASEIVAGALQDYDRALVVGTGPTHGKGTVQAVVNLDQMRRVRGGAPLGIFKITVQQFFRIDGDSTQWRGVVPDVLLPDPAAHIEAGERSLDHSIPWSEIAPLQYTRWPAANWNAKALAAKSQQRRASEPLFAKIIARSALLKKRRDDTLVPLQRSAWLERRKRNRAALDAVDPQLAKATPRQKVTVIDYAGAARKARGSDKGDRRVETWSDDLARDPWVGEALQLLTDMASAR